MSSLNYDCFTNLLEFTEQEFNSLRKSIPTKSIITEMGYINYMKDSSNEIMKSKESEELCKSLIQTQLGTLNSLVKISVLENNFEKSNYYVNLQQLLDENLNFADNILTRKIGLANKPIDVMLEKSFRGETSKERNDTVTQLEDRDYKGKDDKKRITDSKEDVKRVTEKDKSLLSKLGDKNDNPHEDTISKLEGQLDKLKSKEHELSNSESMSPAKKEHLEAVRKEIKEVEQRIKSSDRSIKELTQKDKRELDE